MVELMREYLSISGKQLKSRCLCRSWYYNRSVHKVHLPEINYHFGMWREMRYFCLTDKTEKRSSGRHINNCGWMWNVDRKIYVLSDSVSLVNV